MNALLAISLLLTTATQLRSGDLSLGPGEFCLAVWLVLALVREANRLNVTLTPALSRLLVFWAVFAAAQSLGTLTGYVIGDVHDPSLFVHDILAYCLAAPVSCLSVAGPDAEDRLHRTAWAILILGSVSLVPQLAAGWDLISLPFIDPWFWDRFRGWSSNPNQLALLCALLVFVGLHLADTAVRLGQWIAAVVCSALFIWVGRLTKADTFTFSLASGGVVFLVIKLRTWLISPERKLAMRPAIAVIAVLAVPLMLASAVPYAFSAAAEPESLALGLMKNGGKEAVQEADLRLLLWSEALGRGLDSGMLGLGPGPHLPIPWSVTAGRLTEPNLGINDHPKVNGTSNFEAHNTVLDLFTQGGLIAVLDFVWLAVTAFIIAWKVRSAGLAALLCGLLTFSLTDLIVRPPIFWFGIALCLVAADRVQVESGEKRAAEATGIRELKNAGLC